jgi:hypothetical protein
MKESVGVLLFSTILAFGGCNTAQKADWEYETIAGTNDKVLRVPVSEGWDPIGICVTPDGQKLFLLKRQKDVKAQGNWQFKTVVGRDDKILNNPANQGWELVGVSQMPDSNRWFLLKKPKT